jgi:hypothetical protein
MKHWITFLTLTALAITFIGCEKTVREPGEIEHGGIFLHADKGSSTSQP